MTTWGRAAFGLLAAMALAAVAPVAQAAVGDAAWRPYVDPEGAFMIEFPRGWTVAKDPFQILVATSPKESSADAFRETIKVVATTVAPGVTLDGYYRNSLQVYQSIWTVQSASMGMLGGAKARRAVIDQHIGVLRTRLLKCFVLGAGKVFVITCAGEPATFDVHLPVFEAALATFRIAPGARHGPARGAPPAAPSPAASPAAGVPAASPTATVPAASP